MKEPLLKNFIPYPRSILHDLHEHKLKPSEYDLLMRVRHMANPYAYAAISLEGLEADLKHRGWSKNHINKLLLQLKSKRYLHYDDRAGRRGSFNIHFPDFVLPNGKMTELRDIASHQRGNADPINSPAHSEVNQSLLPRSQSLPDIKASSEALVRKMTVSAPRASYNDTDKENENKRQSYPLKRKILVAEFVPTTYQENECRAIAIEIREQGMEFLLGTLHKEGWSVIEQARREYERADKSKIKNRAAYFNGIVQKLIAAKNNPP